MENQTSIETKLLDTAKYKKEILIWQIVGAVFIFGLGAVWHFMYEWTGSIKGLGWLFPINESVWEHVKLMFYPALLYYVIEAAFLWKKVNNFIFAKTTALYFTPIMNIITFYTYTGITGYESFYIDIIVLLIFTCLQQFISYKILRANEFAPKNKIYLLIFTIFAIIILFVALVVFTYYPLPIPLFVSAI